MTRDHHKDQASFWRAAIELHGRSGVPIKHFCASEGLQEHLFYRWRKKLGLSPVDRRSSDATAPASDSEPASFVPVRLKSEVASIEVSLPNGVQIKCADADLSTLLRALSEAC